MKSKREGNAEIGRIIERHMPLDKADELFSELSKVGGNAFRTAMTRVDNPLVSSLARPVRAEDRTAGYF
jgi:hypothetical protein